jgi:hypothetical protein
VSLLISPYFSLTSQFGAGEAEARWTYPVTFGVCVDKSAMGLVLKREQ